MMCFCLPGVTCEAHALTLLCALVECRSCLCFLTPMLSNFSERGHARNNAACTCCGVAWSQQAGAEALYAYA